MNLASLSLLPKAQAILGDIFKVTGSQMVGDLMTKAANLLQDVGTNATVVAGFNAEMKTFVGIFGGLIPGGRLQQLEDEILKFESYVQQLESGQPVEVAQITESIGGVPKTFALLLQEKAA